MNIKRFLFSLLSVAGFIVCAGSCISVVQNTNSASRYRANNNSILINESMNGVVALVSRSSEGTLRSFCTAFFIRDDILATASHCLSRRVTVANDEVGEAEEMYLPPAINSEYSFLNYAHFQAIQRGSLVTPYHARVVAFNEEQDVALLRITADVPRSLAVFKLNTATLAIGETAYAIGHPVGLNWILTSGLISQVIRNRFGKIVRINATPQIYYGNSGGPLFLTSGEVAGVASGIRNEQAHLGLYTPSNNLMSLLNSLLPPGQRR